MFEILDDVPYTNGGSMCEVACWVGICACEICLSILWTSYHGSTCVSDT